MTTANGKEPEKRIPHYTITGEGVGTGQTVTVEVEINQKNKKFDPEVFARCAVHGVLFRGYNIAQDKKSQEFGLVAATIPGMTDSDKEKQYADYFNNFWEETYSNYAQVLYETRENLKMGDKWRVKVKVTVFKENLRRELEKVGIIKGISGGWE